MGYSRHLRFALALVLTGCGGADIATTTEVSPGEPDTSVQTSADTEQTTEPPDSEAISDSDQTAAARETDEAPAPDTENEIAAEAPEDTGEEIVRAPAHDANPFDNPEMFTEEGKVPERAVQEAFDPNRPMKVPLDFRRPGEILPFPAPNPAQYRQWNQKARIVVGHSHLDSVCFSPDERYVLAMSENEGTVRVYEVNTRKLVNNYSILGTKSFTSFDVLFWPVIEKEPLVLFAKNNGLMLYRALQGEPHSYLIQVNTREIRWSDDKQTLVGIGRPPKQKESVLSFYRRKTPPDLEVIREVPVETYAMEVDISRDNKLLAMAGSGYVELYSLETGEQLWKVPAPESLWSVDISPDSTKVAFGGSYLVIVDIENPERKTTYSKFNNNINRVRFSPSGDAVFVSSYDGRVRIISSDLSNSTGKMLKMLKHGGTANVYEMDFTEDGNLMASVSGDKTVRIWGGKKR